MVRLWRTIRKKMTTTHQWVSQGSSLSTGKVPVGPAGIRGWEGALCGLRKHQTIVRQATWWPPRAGLAVALRVVRGAEACTNKSLFGLVRNLTLRLPCSLKVQAPCGCGALQEVVEYLHFVIKQYGHVVLRLVSDTGAAEAVNGVQAPNSCRPALEFRSVL